MLLGGGERPSGGHFTGVELACSVLALLLIKELVELLTKPRRCKSPRSARPRVRSAWSARLALRPQNRSALAAPQPRDGWVYRCK